MKLVNLGRHFTHQFRQLLLHDRIQRKLTHLFPVQRSDLIEAAKARARVSLMSVEDAVYAELAERTRRKNTP